MDPASGKAQCTCIGTIGSASKSSSSSRASRLKCSHRRSHQNRPAAARRVARRFPHPWRQESDAETQEAHERSQGNGCIAKPDTRVLPGLASADARRVKYPECFQGSPLPSRQAARPSGHNRLPQSVESPPRVQPAPLIPQASRRARSISAAADVADRKRGAQHRVPDLLRAIPWAHPLRAGRMIHLTRSKGQAPMIRTQMKQRPGSDESRRRRA